MHVSSRKIIKTVYEQPKKGRWVKTLPGTQQAWQWAAEKYSISQYQQLSSLLNVHLSRPQAMPWPNMHRHCLTSVTRTSWVIVKKGSQVPYWPLRMKNKPVAGPLKPTWLDEDSSSNYPKLHHKNTYPLTHLQFYFQLLIIAPLHALFNILYPPFNELYILQ